MCAAFIQPKEFRKVSRLYLQVPAAIRFDDGTQYEGETKNIGFSGAIFMFQHVHRIMVGERCSLTLIVLEDDRHITITFQCIVKHISREEVGLFFSSIYPEDYNDFLYLMANNMEDSEPLLEQIKTNPGIAVKG